MDAFHRLSRTAQILAGLFAFIALLGAGWLVAADRTALHDIPRRIAQGRELRLEHWMAIGFRRAAIASVVIGAVGAAGVIWGGRKTLQRGGEWRTGEQGWKAQDQRRFWSAVALCILLGAGIRAPRLSHSLWNDEAYAARAYVWGVKEPQADGALIFKPVPWTRALFLNEKGNNHVWCSLEARLALRAWQSITGRATDEFSETVMRLPAFLWGLLTIGAISLLAAMLVGPRGWIAGLLLAVHPWHVRFSVEMRGYSAMLLALTCGMIFLVLALRDGRWRWWLLAAAMNLWSLLAFAGCLYVPLVANAAALAWLLRRKEKVLAGRLVVANALATIPFLWLYGPSLPQLHAYLRSSAAAAAYQINAAWFRSLWSCLCLGADRSIMSEAWHERIVMRTPLGQLAALAGLTLLFVVQAIRWLRSGHRAGAVPLTFLLAGALGVAQNMLTRSPVLVWYFLPMMLGWALVMIGPPAGDPALATGRATRWRSIGWAVVAMAATFCLAGNVDGFRGLEHHPMRLAAAYPGRLAVLPFTAAVGVSDRQMLLYDPRVAIVHTVADLEKAEQSAATNHQPLLVYVCGWEESERRLPTVMARLRTPGYQPVADLPGWEAMFSYRLLQKSQ